MKAPKNDAEAYHALLKLLVDELALGMIVLMRMPDWLAEDLAKVYYARDDEEGSLEECYEILRSENPRP
jgi:hypothetical protein